MPGVRAPREVGDRVRVASQLSDRAAHGKVPHLDRDILLLLCYICF